MFTGIINTGYDANRFDLIPTYYKVDKRVRDQ